MHKVEPVEKPVSLNYRGQTPLVASEGLNPAAQGARIAVADGKRYVVDGPFAESKELVGGFYIIEVPSLEDAIQWALRAPTGLGHGRHSGYPAADRLG